MGCVGGAVRGVEVLTSRDLFQCLRACGKAVKRKKAFSHLVVATLSWVYACVVCVRAWWVWQAAQAPSAYNKWVLHLQGGGECVAKDTCTAATQSTLGSSKYFSQQMVGCVGCAGPLLVSLLLFVCCWWWWRLLAGDCWCWLVLLFLLPLLLPPTL